MKKVLILIIFIYVFTLIPVCAEEEKKINFFVDGKVQTSGDGSIVHPFKTLEEARDTIRVIKKEGNYPKNGIIVNIRGGQYSILDSFKLDEKDSGMENAPIIYKPYALEEVEFVGGAEISLKDCEIVSNQNVLQKVPSAANGKIYQINLKEKGIEGYGEMFVTGHSSYYTRLYGITKKGPPVPEIFYNNQVMSLARYPNEGYMLIDKVIDTGDVLDIWYNKEASKRNNPPVPMTFQVADDHISKWGNANQAWVFGYWKYDWSDETTPVKKIDVSQKSIQTVYGSPYEITKGQRFYIYNLIEELDIPGEWFYDNESGILYIYPLDTNANSKMLLSFSQLPIMMLDKVENVQIREMSFKATRSSAIVATDCKNIKFSYCSISNVSSSGIDAENSYSVTIEGCHIYSTGAKSIDISGGDRYTLTPSNNLVFNNWLHNFGRLIKTYEGGVRATGVGNIVRNNLIYDGAHLAINPGGNDNIIENNEIHSVLKESSDMGTIYADFGMTARGNIIRSNLIHNLHTNSAQGHAVQAIYLDNSSSGSTVEGNVIYDVGGNGVFINGGRDNTVTNNIFADLTNSISFTASGLAVTWGWYGQWLDGSRHFGLKGNNPVPYESKLYSKYPHMNGILEDNPPYPKYNVFKNNVSYNVEVENNVDPLAATGTGITKDDMLENNTIMNGVNSKKDVGFVSAKNGDYTLKSNSEVFTKLPEFKNVDISKMGLITSKLKELLSNNATVLAIGKPITYVNWKRKLIDSENLDVVPVIINDKTYIPAKFLAEAFGAEVKWNDGQIIINYSGTEMKLTPNSKSIMINNETAELDNEAIIINGRTFVPLSAFTKYFNKNIYYNEVGLVIVSDEKIEDKLTELMISDLINRI